MELKTQLLERIQPIFKDVFDDNALVITRDTNAKQVEGWDSLGHINLVVAIEQEFKFRFALSELQGLKNVGDLIDLMATKLGHA